MNIFQRFLNAITPITKTAATSYTLDTALLPKQTDVRSVMYGYADPLITQTRREIEDLIYARTLAQDSRYPERYALIEIYDNLLLNDAHLSATIEKRINSLLSCDFEIVDKNSGIENEEKTAIFKKQWFEKFLIYELQAKFFGYSLIEVLPSNKEKNDFIVNNVNRKAVSPEYKKLYFPALDSIRTAKIDYTEKPYSNQLIEICEDSFYLGLLNTVAFLGIYKRHSWAAWDSFEQSFGVPIMYGKSDSNAAQANKDFIDFLINRGRDSTVVLPEGMDLQISEVSKGDSFEVFKQKINLIDEQISKLVLNATMTMDNGSSRSQGEVHEESEKTVFERDKKNAFYNVNNKLLPLLYQYGFSENDLFVWSEENDIYAEEQIKIDSVLLQNGYKLDANYIEGMYGVVLDKKAMIEAEKQAAIKTVLPKTPDVKNNVTLKKKAKTKPFRRFI